MPVIALTREIGSHGTDVAAAVASQLRIKVINAEIVSTSASGTLGVEQRAIQRYVDGSASILERWRIDKRKLSQLTSEEILRIGAQGNVLIRGWGAAALFRDVPQVISVRVCAPMTLRERLIMERLRPTTANPSARKSSATMRLEPRLCARCSTSIAETLYFTISC